MKGKNGNVILFGIAICLLVILCAMLFVKLFLYKDTKEEYQPVKELENGTIEKLTTYLDIANLDHEITFYSGSYVTSNNLNFSTMAKVTYNYIKLYDKDKLESVNIDNCIYKISKDNFLESVDKVFGDNNFYLSKEHYNNFTIDLETYATLEDDYLYIYKKDREENVYKYYHGLTSYTVADNNNTIILTEYYLRCNKETFSCYNNTKENPMEENKSVGYSNSLDIKNVVDRLSKYNHTFKKIDGEYKWVSVDLKR